MNSIFTPEGHQDIISRINTLDENTQANWGKMNVEQMLKHCQLPLNVATEKDTMKVKAGFLKRFIFKSFIKPHMYNDKPWKPNLKTLKEFVITDAQVFATEKEKLTTLVNEFANKKDNTNWPTHPLFGDFTTEQRGKMQYKHLDHHLKQFGV